MSAKNQARDLLRQAKASATSKKAQPAPRAQPVKRARSPTLDVRPMAPPTQPPPLRSAPVGAAPVAAASGKRPRSPSADAAPRTTASSLPAGFFDSVDQQAEAIANELPQVQAVINEAQKAEWAAFERDVITEANAIPDNVLNFEAESEDEAEHEFRKEAEEALVVVDAYSRIDQLKAQQAQLKRRLEEQRQQMHSKPADVSMEDDSMSDDDEFDWRSKML